MPLVKKNKTAGLVPYRFSGGKFFLYLQMRTADAPHNPNKFALFGGKLEAGESATDALIRETKEELSIIPKGYHLLGEFEEDVSIVSLFYMKTNKNFESEVIVCEGQYGKFISEDDIVGNPLILEKHQKILSELLATLKKDTARV